MSHRLALVVSQSPSQNPKKRGLEERLVAELLDERGIDVIVIPHLYDLKAGSASLLSLAGITGDLVVCSWLFPRAARWILDRNQIRGQEGATLLQAFGEDDNHQDEEGQGDEQHDDKPRVIDRREMPSRRIFCLDLRAYTESSVFIEEIRRIANELNTSTVQLNGWINGNPKPEQMERYLAPQTAPTAAAPQAIVIDDDADRRWYPVIDFGRCTNCLECIDFCLFGVYGIDAQETILVEQPDNCRQGCPACSRVCPENAIIFPQHKTPTIAGSSDVAGSMKIDLSQLFGAPDPGAPGLDSAVDVAARERDEQLLLAGRQAVGKEVGLPRRHTAEKAEATTSDDLDQLIDSLDEFDL